MTVAELLTFVHPWLEECDGVTISGGEPFEQPDALLMLLRWLRLLKSTNILVYSGKRFEDLVNTTPVAEGLIDCLISEPFDLKSSQTRHLMGSDNQRMTFLTSLGSKVFRPLDRPTRDADRRLDVMFDNEGAVWLAGIPSRGDMARLQSLLQGEGTYLRTTEAKV